MPFIADEEVAAEGRFIPDEDVTGRFVPDEETPAPPLPTQTLTAPPPEPLMAGETLPQPAAASDWWKEAPPSVEYKGPPVPGPTGEEQFYKPLFFETPKAPAPDVPPGVVGKALLAAWPQGRLALGDQGATAALRAGWDLAAGLFDFAQSPAGAYGAVGTTISAPATAAVFAADVIKGLWQQAPELGAKWDTMTWPEKVSAVVSFGGQTAMAGLLTAGAAAGLKPKAHPVEVPAPPERPVTPDRAADLLTEPVVLPEAKVVEPAAVAAQPGITDAERIRSDQRLAEEARQEQQRSEADRRHDLEQAPPGQPEPVVAGAKVPVETTPLAETQRPVPVEQPAAVPPEVEGARFVYVQPAVGKHPATWNYNLTEKGFETTFSVPVGANAEQLAAKIAVKRAEITPEWRAEVERKQAAAAPTPAPVAPEVKPAPTEAVPTAAPAVAPAAKPAKTVAEQWAELKTAKAVADAEFKRLVETYGEQQGWIRRPDAILSEGERKIKGQLGTIGIKASITSNTELAKSYRNAMSAMGDKSSVNDAAHRAAALPKLKAYLEAHAKLEPVPLSDLGEGSEFTILGEKYTVGQTDVDTGNVTIADGKTFKVDENGAVSIDPGSLKKVPLSTEFLPPEGPTPKLAAGVNQGDLIASTQKEDFALVGEKATDVERIAAAKLKGTADAKAAEEFAKKHQRELPAVEPPKPGAPEGGETGTIVRGPSGGLGRAEEPSGSTRRSIFSAEQRRVAEVQAEEPVSQPFVTSERVQQLLDKIGVPSAERYLPRRLLGIFKHRSENIRVKALADAFTAAHEASHFISHTFGIAKRLIQDTTHGERLRRRLTDIYTEFYPGAKRSHKLSKRIEEGIAVLMENYAYEPTKIMEKYPDLVATFIKPTGKYYHPKFTELLNGIGDIVGEHARLTPEQQIGARIVRGEEVLKRDTGFTWRQRLVWELFNAAEPLRRWAKKAGVSETIADPTVWYYSWLDKGTLIANWITGDHTVRFTPDGKIIREPGTIKTYGRMIEGREKEFDAYLVSRRVVEDHNRLADLKQQIVERETALEEGGLEPSELREAQAELDSVKQSAQRLANVLARDNINLSAATAVVNKFDPAFRKPVAVFDSINERLVRLAADHGLIKQAWADELLARKGYASFLKFVTDDLAGGDGNPYSLTSQSKAKAFKERTGNELNIVSPVFNQAVAVHEVVAKAMQNDVWRKVLDLGDKNPEIARRFEVIETVRLPDETGRITYPQDRDPNLLKVWKNGQRVFVKAAPEFRALVDFMRPNDMGLVAQLLTTPSSVFTRLTTSANPIFAVGNLTVDQVSALMQTKTGYKPGVEPVRGVMQFVREFSKLTPEDQKVMKTFLEAGGKRTTLAASLRETTPEKFITGLEKPHGTAAKMMNVVDSGLNILELPSNFSEYLSRFGEYKRALAQGDAPIVALYRAAEVTTPFKLRGHLGGKVGQVWVRAIPYLNAALQVNYKFGRTVAENPARVATVAAGAVAVAFVTAIAVMQASTDRQKRLLRNLESGELGRYLFFPLPDGKRLARFRIPEHLGALTAPVYLFTMAAYGGNVPGFDALLDASTQWIPDALNVTEPKKAALNLIPTALKPSVQVAANLKTYPHIAPIVPEYVVENTTPADQYTAYTSKVAVGLGKILGLSPSKIEFWVRNQFGAVGGMLMGKFQSMPVVKGESEVSLSGRLYNEFYEQRQVLAQQATKLKAHPQAFTASERYQIQSSHAAFEKMATELAKLRKLKTLDERTRQQTFQKLESLLR